MRNNNQFLFLNYSSSPIRILYGIKPDLKWNKKDTIDEVFKFLQEDTTGKFIRALHVFIQSSILISFKVPVMPGEKQYLENMGLIKIPNDLSHNVDATKTWITQVIEEFHPQFIILLDWDCLDHNMDYPSYHIWKNWHEEKVRDIYTCEGKSTKVILTARPEVFSELGFEPEEMVKYLGETIQKNLEDMSKVKFNPFVGTNYSNGVWGHKTLILGESHYGDGVEYEGVTNEVINYFLDADSEHEGWMNTYTKFGKAMACSDINKEGQRQVWNQVVFYNYIQHFLPKNRQSPTNEEFRESLDAFLEILDRYQPEVVIVWGERMFRNLPSIGQALPSFTSSSGDTLEIWGYPLKSGKLVPLLPIYHPSAGFSWEKWGIIIKEFIQKL